MRYGKVPNGTSISTQAMSLDSNHGYSQYPNDTLTVPEIHSWYGVKEVHEDHDTHTVEVVLEDDCPQRFESLIRDVIGEKKPPGVMVEIKKDDTVDAIKLENVKELMANVERSNQQTTIEEAKAQYVNEDITILEFESMLDDIMGL